MLFDDRECPIGLLSQSINNLDDLIDDQRSKSHKRYIHEQQTQIAHQRARDAQHLLPAAGPRIAAIGAALFQAGEEF